MSFFEKLSEKLSFDEFAHEMNELAIAHEAAFGEFAAEARDWAEENIGPWSSDEFYGLGGPRTEADLEELSRQEDAARSARQSQSGGAEPSASARSAEPSQNSGRQGGRGIGDAKRNGDQIEYEPEPSGAPVGQSNGTRSGRTEPVTALNATEPFEPVDGHYVDKADNIRLDNLNREDDVKSVLRQLIADRGGRFPGHAEAITDQQRSDMADSLGLNMNNFVPKKPDDVRADVWTDAVQKLNFTALDATFAAQQKFAESGNQEDYIAYLETKQRLFLISDYFSNTTADAGRVLRVFNKKEMQFANDYVSLLRAEDQGRTFNQALTVARAASKMKTPADLAKFLQDSRKASFGDMLLEYWINGLISNPATHVTYMTGIAMMSVARAVPETAAAALVDSIKEVLGKGGDDRVYWGEVGAQLHGIWRGQRNGIQAAYEAGRTGLTTNLPGEGLKAAQGSFLAMAPRAEGAIPGVAGTTARLPSRGVAVLHSYSRAIGYSQELSALAYRQAMKEGLDGTAFVARVAHLTQNPDEAMMGKARDAATKQTLMGQGGAVTNAVADLFNTRLKLPILGEAPYLKFIDPFVKIGSNIMNEALLERTALGFIDPEIRANLMRKNGSIAQSQQIGRISVGTAIGMAVLGLAAEGLITGGGPSDPKGQAEWKMLGKQPYSIRLPFGNTYYQYHRLGPLAMVMGVAADMYEFGAAMDSKDASHLAQMLVGSLAKNLLDESFMRGPSDLMRAVNDSDRYGAQYARDQLATFLPFSSAMSAMARASDPYAREARTTMDVIKSRIPFVSQSLEKRYDIWGQPVPNRSALGGAALTSIYESYVNNDPTTLAMIRLGNLPAPAKRDILGVPLTSQQYADYAMTSGRLMKMMLDQFVHTPGFSSVPDGIQDKHMRDIVEKARKIADTKMKLKYQNIIQQANENKRIIFEQGRAAERKAVQNQR